MSAVQEVNQVSVVPVIPTQEQRLHFTAGRKQYEPGSVKLLLLEMVDHCISSFTHRPHLYFVYNANAIVSMLTCCLSADDKNLIYIFPHITFFQNE